MTGCKTCGATVGHRQIVEHTEGYPPTTSYMPCPKGLETVSRADYEAVLETADRLRRYAEELEQRLKVGSERLTVELNEHNREFRRNSKIAKALRRAAVDADICTAITLGEWAALIESGDELP